MLNTLRPRQDGCRFPDDIFKCIFFNENVLLLIKISLKFVPKVWINNVPALVQMMAWRRPGDKPLSEPMMVRLLMYICITQPQWVNEMISLYVFWFQHSCQAVLFKKLVLAHYGNSTDLRWRFCAEFLHYVLWCQYAMGPISWVMKPGMLLGFHLILGLSSQIELA